MQEEIIHIETGDGQMETFVTRPEEGGPFPAVIVYMDFWGIREELYDIARRIGTVGYCVLVPDWYYRQGKVRTEFRNEKNQMISLSRLDEKTREETLAPLGKLTNAMVVSDTGAVIDHLRDQESVKFGAMGSIGYCMGGRHVMCVAGAYPEHFRAGASLHGTTLVSDAEDSPHRQVDRFRGEFYGGFAEHDPYAPLDMIEDLDRMLAAAPVRHRFEIHAGAEHGYALPNRDIHHRHAAARDWERTFAMFHRQIPPAFAG